MVKRQLPVYLLMAATVACSACSRLPADAAVPPGTGGTETAGFRQAAAFAASGAAPAWSLGGAVALDGDTALVGAPGGFDDATSTGSALIYRRGEDGDWHQAASLTPPDPEAARRFGHAVAIAGDVAAVAGEQAVYLYRRGVDGKWSLEQVLLEPQGLSVVSVALAGDTLAVGESTTPAVHVFEYLASDGGEGEWHPVATLGLADVGLEFAYHFARDLDLSQDGETLIVANPGSDDQYYRDAAAYIFARGEDGWRLAQTLRAPDDATGGWGFGWAVALEGRLAAVASVPAAGVNKAPLTIYERGTDLGNWEEVAQLEFATLSPDEAEGVQLEHSGRTVTVGDGMVAVGAYGVTCYPDEGYDSRCPPGQVYLVARGEGGAWVLVQTLRADGALADQQFGRALALGPGRLVVGARGSEAEGGPRPGVFIFERQ